MWKLLYPGLALRLKAIRRGRAEAVFASRPAILQPNFGRWLRTYRSECAKDLCILVGTSALALTVHPAMWLGALWQFGRIYSYWRWVASMQIDGCANPAVVLSTSPLRLACYADLSGGTGTWPALKVFQMPDKAVGCGEAQVGDRLACVCYYRGDGGDVGMWSDFHPYPDVMLTADPEERERLRGSLVQDDSERDLWGKLDLALKIVGANPGLGLYRLGWEPTSMDAMLQGAAGVSVDLTEHQAQTQGGLA